MAKTEFLIVSKSIQDEKINALKVLVKESANSIPTEIAGIKILSDNDFEAFPKEKVISLKRGLDIYDTESLAVRGLLDSLGINAFIINKSFFNYLTINLGLFKKYEAHGNILIANRPMKLFELNQQLIALNNDLKNEKGLFSAITKKGIEKSVKEKEKEINNFFVNAEKKILMAEMFPGLSSFALTVGSFEKTYQNEIVQICQGYSYQLREDKDKFMQEAMSFINNGSGSNRLAAAIKMNWINLPELLKAYEYWISKGFSQKFISVKITFPEPPELAKTILKKFALNKFDEICGKAKLCVVADTSAVGIEPMASSLHLIEPKPSDPGLALEFNNCVAIIPDTFYYLENSEKELLAKAKEVSEKWNPVESFLTAN